MILLLCHAHEGCVLVELSFTGGRAMVPTVTDGTHLLPLLKIRAGRSEVLIRRLRPGRAPVMGMLRAGGLDRIARLGPIRTTV